MPNLKFFLITIDPPFQAEKAGEIKNVIATAIDWYRYAPNSWIVWSVRTPAEWYELLKPRIDNQNLFICELRVGNRQGWMPRSFWDWLNKEGRADEAQT